MGEIRSETLNEKKHASYVANYAANREAIKEKSRAYYAVNREAIKEKSCAYQAANREAIKEEKRCVAEHSTRKYSVANRDARDTEWLTEVELAAWLHVSRAKLQWDRARVQGPPFVRLGHCVRYNRAMVAAWLAERIEGGS